MAGEGAESVAAVVVNYRQEPFLGRLMTSLLEQTLLPSTVVLVHSRPSPFEAPPGVISITCSANRGYAAALNRGILRAMEAGAASFLALNADSFLDRRCIELLASAPGDIVQPLILLAGKPGRINAAGLAPTRFGFAYCMKYMRHASAAGLSAVPVPAASGAAMLVRRRVFERAGPFDEGFFMYLEDVEFCLRARRMGFETFLEPKARAWHHYRWGLSASKAASLWRNARIVRGRFTREELTWRPRSRP